MQEIRQCALSMVAGVNAHRLAALLLRAARSCACSRTLFGGLIDRVVGAAAGEVNVPAGLHER
jgi:hypothetical protein